MKSIKILPWIGKNYSAGFAGKHVLVLGESHYCASSADFCPEITRNVISDLFAEGSVFEPYKNTYTKFAKAMTGLKKLSNTDKETFWNSIAFYNYVQFPLSGPRRAPLRAEFRDSEESFFEVLEILRPEVIIVWGKRLYTNLPQRGVQGPDICAPDGKWLETWIYSLEDGRQVTVLPVRHPSSAFSPAYWFEVIMKTLKKG